MRRRSLHRSFCLLLFAFCLLSSGFRQNRDLVEAELRSKDRDLHCLRDELYRSEGFNEALRREICVLRGISPSAISPEAAGRTYGVTTVTLGRQTGGYDSDSGHGDDA